MMRIKKIPILLLAIGLLVILAPAARADDWYLQPGGYYTVNTQDGRLLFTYAGQVTVDDEYISGDNKRYRVVEVNDTSRTGTARFIEDVVLWEGYEDAMLQQLSAEQGAKRVALYCTHNTESYVKGDGTESKPNEGGIMDVANSLADSLKKRSVDAVVDNTSHEPHDAGAYRRSRVSAMNLIESVRPDLLLDIHRDGVPDPKEYNEEIEGTEASKIRFVVGRGNQNRAANEDTVKQLKKVADSTYPGLIKDIFIGKGSYNQDLTPNSMIIEIGTHTVEKDRALQTTDYIADVIAEYLGASKSGQQKAPAQGQTKNEPQPQQQAERQPTANRTAGRSIAWVVGLVAAVGLAFLLVATFKGHRKERVGNFFREVTGLGKHRDKK